MASVKPQLSIIIPLHNEEANLKWHHDKLKTFLEQNTQSYEIIYVDDGSTDDSLEIIKELARSDSTIRFITFSRNFGKEAATTAGLAKSRGEAVVLMDADGQHPVELIREFLDRRVEGYEVIVGVRKSNQGEGFLKSFGSKLFYRVLGVLDGNNKTVAGLTDFRLLDRKVVDEYNKLTERNRVTRNLIDWLGYRRVLVPFHAHKRHAGKATYSYNKLIKLAIDGVVKHSTKPLKLIGIIGLLVSFLSVTAAIALIIEQYVLNDPLNLAVTGTAILALLLCFMVGIVLVCQGLLALYIENVYYETQNRPLYVISDESV